MPMKKETMKILNEMADVITDSEKMATINAPDMAGYIRRVLQYMERDENLNLIKTHYGLIYTTIGSTEEKKKRSMEIILAAMNNILDMMQERSSPTEIIQETRQMLDEAAKTRKEELKEIHEQEKAATKRINEISQRIGEMMNERKTSKEILNVVHMMSKELE